MTRDPFKVTPETSVFTAMEMLYDKKVSGLAVIGILINFLF